MRSSSDFYEVVSGNILRCEAPESLGWIRRRLRPLTAPVDTSPSSGSDRVLLSVTSGSSLRIARLDIRSRNLLHGNDAVVRKQRKPVFDTLIVPRCKAYLMATAFPLGKQSNTIDIGSRPCLPNASRLHRTKDPSDILSRSKLIFSYPLSSYSRLGAASQGLARPSKKPIR